MSKGVFPCPEDALFLCKSRSFCPIQSWVVPGLLGWFGGTKKGSVPPGFRVLRFCTPIKVWPFMPTHLQCKRAVCPSDEKHVRYYDSGGLYLQVSPWGSKRWLLKYRIDQKQKQFALGSYPAVGGDRLRAGLRDSAKLQKAGGVDPVQARKLARLKGTREGGETFKAVALEWHTKQLPRWSSTHADLSDRDGRSRVDACPAGV